MSAATSEWPAWLRRRSAVELLGPPGRFFAWVTIALSLGAILYVGAWNAAKYPIPLGYDAQAHIEYAHVLTTDHRLPTLAETAESHQPPAYYALAGLAAKLGHTVFGWHEDAPYSSLPEVSYRGAQIFNILLALATALSILWIARLLAPGRPWMWAASVSFFAFLPVVGKTVAMFHPDNLNMAASSTAIAVATHMLVRRSFRRRYVIALAVALGLAIGSRASGVFTILAVLVGIAAAMRRPELRAEVPWRRLAIGVAAALVLLLPWVAYRGIVQHRGPLNNTNLLLNAALHPNSVNLTDAGTTRGNFWKLPVSEMLDTPWRTHFKNVALAETYTEIWGDWIGAFAWSPYSVAPTPDAQRVLRDQNAIGVGPTLLAIAGWLGLVYLAIRRRPELTALAVLPVIAVGGYLYRSYLALSHDGDLFKASYVLNTVPAWSIGFALATGWLASRSRLARYSIIALFAVFAVLELRFMLYGIRDHRPIF